MFADSTLQDEYISLTGVPVQPPRPQLASDKWVAVASGLCVGDPAVDAPRLLLLVDWLKGMLGDVELCQQVCRLIICGAPCSMHCFVLSLLTSFVINLEVTAQAARHRCACDRHLR